MINRFPAFILVLIFSASFKVNSNNLMQAEHLLDVMRMDRALENSMAAMLDFQIKQNPELAPFEEVIKTFLRKYMSYSNVKPELVAIYADAFTQDEIRQLVQFYSTPVGQKTIDKIPELMAKGGQIGALRVQENLAELQSMIADESARLKSHDLSEL